MRVDVEIREESISFFGVGIDFGDIGGIAIWQQLLVNAGAANNVDLMGRIIVNDLTKLIEVVGYHGVNLVVWIAGDNDVVAVWQRLASREGLKGFAAVDYAVAGGKSAESLEVFRDMEEQLAVFADGPILIDGYNDIHVTSFLDRNRDIFNLFAGLIVLDDDVVRRKVVEILDVRIESDGRGRVLFAFNEFLDDWHVPVIDVSIGNHVNESAGLHADGLSNHHEENAVLNDVPVVGGQDVLRTLVENGVKSELIATFFLSDIEGHTPGARIEIHLVKIGVVVDAGENATAEWGVFEIPEHAVDLIHLAFFVLMLDAQLVAIGFADATIGICPFVPNVGVQVMDVVGLFLPNPKDLVGGRLDCGAAQGDGREFLLEIVASANTKLLDSVGWRAIFPVRTNLFALSVGAILENVTAHSYKLLISFTHEKIPPFVL